MIAMLIGWAVISAILYGIFNTTIGHTAGLIAVGVYTVISIGGVWAELQYRKGWTS